MKFKIRWTLFTWLAIMAVIMSRAALADAPSYFPKTKAGQQAIAIEFIKTDVDTSHRTLLVEEGYRTSSGKFIKRTFSIILAASTKAYRLTWRDDHWSAQKVAFNIHDLEKADKYAEITAVGVMQAGKFKCAEIYYRF